MYEGMTLIMHNKFGRTDGKICCLYYVVSTE